MTPPPSTIHATTVAIGGHGVLLLGASGSGKSDLALRLIDRGAVLVADDRTIVRRDGDRLRASVPDSIAGRIEVRGVGILPAPAFGEITLALAVSLDHAVERLPDPDVLDLEGVRLPRIALAAFEASTPIKIERALAEMM